MSRWRLWLIGGVVSLLAIYFIVSQIAPAAVWSSLRGARWIYVLPSAESNLLDEWLEARSNATTWEKSAKSIKQQLEARMGDDEFLVVDGQDADDEAALTMSTENRAAKVKDVLAVVEERHGKDERKAIEAEVMSRRKKGRTLRVTTVAKVREKAGEEA